MRKEAANWTELRAQANARLDTDLARLKAEGEGVMEVIDRAASTLTAAIDGSPEYLARVFAVGGTARARGACYLADEALPRLLAYGDEPPEVAPTSAVGVLSYVALLRCLEVALPPAAEGLESRWLPLIAAQPEVLTDFHRRHAAFAAVANGLVDLVPTIQQSGPLEPRRESRDVSGVDVDAFTRHLAEALAGGGGADAVERPWHAFLQAFPLTITASRADWMDLVWAGIVMMVRFEQRPIAEVGRWLPPFVGERD
jgi:hypothetical protein